MRTHAGSVIGTVIRRVARTIGGAAAIVPVARCTRVDVRSEQDIRTAAGRVLPRAAADRIRMQSLLRELVALNTPALYLNVVQRAPRVHVVLRPWDGSSIRFRGGNYFVDAGSDSMEGSEAFVNAPFSHVTMLYPTAPDHPVYVISIENQGQAVITGDVPPYLTHVTIVVNGRVITQSERLLRERGPQIWAA
jgi:hypothetical protein